MYNIKTIIWLLPILFMIHDFEEIIMAEAWSKRFKKELKEDTFMMKKKPFGLNDTGYWSTAAFSIGVEIIFVILSVASILSCTFNSYFIWYGFLFAFTFHLIFAHFYLCIQFKHYVPGVVTSALFLPVCIYIMYISKSLLKYDLSKVLLSCIAGIIFGIIILISMHDGIKNFSKLLKRYSLE
ncbi:HXXEE domain-containing protein [Clostridium tyrobutyricum]|uniref:HXXEE domain-containing protein n=1 Tax=Clostridium tyrobutyricum TaxID=1519 RepID=UPI001C380CF3|nr:HXXEE domain-containing protein [Clostridium tyrobutyricum]MBV4417834.1 HXXEE domain-containing protein [Clostridium tyrobutyricum]